MAAYEDALAELYQVPLAQFVAERKRLTAELKAAGNKTGARLMSTRQRPTISAWVVNQLYWHARDGFDELLATAERLRSGELAASAAHRDAIAKLRKRAAAILEDAGHNASEGTLRRVTMTLSAIAATGGFAPDVPGTLAEDRDPPGFEAVGIPAEPIAAPAPKPRAKAKPKPKDEQNEPNEATEQAPDGDDRSGDDRGGKDDLAAARAAAKQREQDAEAQRREEMAEKKREEEQRKQTRAERHRLETALRTAKGELDTRERAVKALEKQLRASNDSVSDAQAVVTDIEAKLEELADDEE